MTKFSIQKIYKNPEWSGQTATELEHLQSIIDLRRRQSRDRSYSKYGKKCDSRILINVGGLHFETLQSTLERYPNTLLGNVHHRSLFYDKKRNEYFFDRHRLCFEAILYYYQSRGRIRRPENVPLDTFLEEITFFGLGLEALSQVRKDENLEEAERVQLPHNRFCRHLWANLEYPQYSMTAKIFHIFSAIFILSAAIGLAIETLPYYRGKYSNHCKQEGDGLLIHSNNTSTYSLCPANFHSPFFIIQSICIAFFTIEFLLRLISCPSHMNFIKSILNWIDFLAIVPYFITLIINLLNFHEMSSQTYFCLSLLRIFRFMRVFKLYRTFQYVKSLRVLMSTLKESIPDFVILLSFLTLSGFLFGAAIYFAENDDTNPHALDSIPTATYYGIVTLTAVGYGELTPTTPLGRGLACLAAIYGISIVSMLVSVLVGRYQRVYNRKRFCNEGDSDTKMLNNSCACLKSEEDCLESPADIGKAFGSISESDNDEQEEIDKRSGKVRFMIGYVSDEDNENDIEKTNDNTSEFSTKLHKKSSNSN